MKRTKANTTNGNEPRDPTPQLTQQQIQQCREKLMVNWQKIKDEITAISRTDEEEDPDFNNSKKELGDLASFTQHSNLLAAQIQRKTRELNLAQNALNRIANGTYGKDLLDNNKANPRRIPWEVLKLSPAAITIPENYFTAKAMEHANRIVTTTGS